MGGKFHLKLNIHSRPIVNKYREGKVKRTLKRELKVPEIAGREAIETSGIGQIASHVLERRLGAPKGPRAAFKAPCVVPLTLRVSVISASGKNPVI